jgi:hypothetical protein
LPIGLFFSAQNVERQVQSRHGIGMVGTHLQIGKSLI